MRDLLDRLRTIETRQRELREEHATVVRAIVVRAGGVSQAAALLGLDPKTVRARERAAGVAMVVYRGSHTARTAPDGRLHGETGQGEDSPAQRDADRMWFAVARDRRPLLRAVVYVVDGRVARVREVGGGQWQENPEGRVALPLGPPLTPADLAERLPTMPLAVGDSRPMVRGRIREYIAL
ncbi:hypothetical protein CUT44_06310 [Streptomyces carminius]|uniref:Uncharacterized protein n=1 Tax=Streptomyces carminius TaxID=2665496 RepID=A0A2M8M4Q0_9ACTN|nr:hypothetical protein [Streptomyces carminius]PJE99192.1 hypothetical protein CUT44_06310 [Streptomyces carminius]